jgi:hypothetical protein
MSQNGVPLDLIASATHLEFNAYMRSKLPAFLLLGIIGSVAASCSRTISAVDRQRLNHAMTYFLYSQANAQLARMPIGIFSVRNNPMDARAWVVRGLRRPERIVAEEEIGGHAGIEPRLTPEGFSAGFSFGGEWTRWYVDNPKASVADALIQLFNDAQVSWDPHPREHLWHLSQAYKDDYEWARNEDRFKFPLAFYQDPYPETCR